VRKASVPEDKNKNDGPLPDERLRTDENGAAHASANGSSPERSEAPLEPPPRETRIDPAAPEPAPAKEESGTGSEASGSGEDSKASAREEARARKAREKEEKKAAAAAAKEAQKEAKEAKSKEKRDKDKDAAAQGREGEAPRQGRLARLRFSKKKDMPGGLWLKCESCAEVIFRKELEEKDRVCPSCGFHFTVPGRERVRMVLDEGTWSERFEELESSTGSSSPTPGPTARSSSAPVRARSRRRPCSVARARSSVARSCSPSSTSASSAARWARSWARRSRWLATWRARRGLP